MLFTVKTRWSNLLILNPKWTGLQLVDIYEKTEKIFPYSEMTSKEYENNRISRMHSRSKGNIYCSKVHNAHFKLASLISG